MSLGRRPRPDSPPHNPHSPRSPNSSQDRRRHKPNNPTVICHVCSTRQSLIQNGSIRQHFRLVGPDRIVCPGTHQHPANNRVEAEREIDIEGREEKEEQEFKEEVIVAEREINFQVVRVPPRFRSTRLWYKLPEGCQQPFISLVRPLLIKLFDEDGNMDSNVMTQLFALPQRELVRSHGNLYKSGRLLKRKLMNTHSSILREMEPEQAQINHEAADYIPGLNRAVELARNGYIQQATKVAERSMERFEINSDSMDQVKALHPEASAIQFPELPANSNRFMRVDAAAVRKQLRRLDTGAMPGPSGWSPSHLLSLMKDEICADKLCQLFTSIMNGDIGHICKDLFLNSDLCLIPKPGTNIPRPIAKGETFLRVAARLVLSHLPSSNTLFPSGIQKGIAVAGGCETALHSAQAALEAGASNQHIVFSSDFSNAFGKRDRSIMAQKFFANADLEPAYRLFNFLYSEKSNLLLDSEEFPLIFSSSGARQGCVTGTLAFCVSVDHVYSRVKEAGGDVVSNAIIDDQSVVGSIENVTNAIRELVAIGRLENLELNFPKCRILWPYSDPVPDTVQNLCREFDFNLVEGAMKLHGGTIGLDNEVRKSIINTKMEKHSKFFSLLSHKKFPSQLVPRFLRMSAIPRAQFIAATTPPAVSSEILSNFGRKIIQTFVEKFEIPLPVEGDDVDLILRAPVREFGWGLSCPSKMAPAAFLASLTRATPHFPSSIQYKINGDTLIPSVQAASIIIDSIIESLPNLNREYLPSINMETGLLANPQKVENISLQKIINSALQSDSLKKAIDNKSTAFVLKINELKESAVKRLHNILPLRNELALNNQTYPLVVRHMLGLAPANDMPASCYCGSPLSNPSHFHACQKTRGNSVTARHNNCAITIGKLVTLAGGDFEREPQLCEENGKRMDGLIHLPSGTYAFDVSVVHTSCPSYVRNRKSHSHLMDDRKLVKNNSYFQRCRDNGVAFSPFVLTSYGVFSDDAINLLKKIAECAESNSVDSAKSFLSRAVDEILITLHKGNARISTAGLIASRRREERIHPNRRVHIIRVDNANPTELVAPVAVPLALELLEFIDDAIANIDPVEIVQQPEMEPIIAPINIIPVELAEVNINAPTIECILCLEEQILDKFPSSLTGCACEPNEKQSVCTICIQRHLTENYSACTICKAPISSIVLHDNSVIPIEYKAANYVPDPADEASAIEALLEMDRVHNNHVPEFNIADYADNNEEDIMNNDI